MARRWLLIAAAAALALGAVAVFTKPTPAPALAGSTLSGSAIQTDALRGRPYLVNFWATSCVTCIREMPELIALHQKYQQQGFRILAVAMAYDRPDHLAAFVADRQLPFDVIHDTDGRWARAYGDITATPTTFLVSAEGQLMKRYVGLPDFAELNRLVGGQL